MKSVQGPKGHQHHLNGEWKREVDLSSLATTAPSLHLCQTEVTRNCLKCCQDFHDVCSWTLLPFLHFLSMIWIGRERERWRDWIVFLLSFHHRMNHSFPFPFRNQRVINSTIFRFILHALMCFSRSFFSFPFFLFLHSSLFSLFLSLSALLTWDG